MSETVVSLVTAGRISRIPKPEGPGSAPGAKPTSNPASDCRQPQPESGSRPCPCRSMPRASAGAPVRFRGSEALVRGSRRGAAWDSANGGGTGSVDESRLSRSSRPSPERSCSSIAMLLRVAGSICLPPEQAYQVRAPGTRGLRLTGRLPAHRALLYFIVVIGAGGACVDRCEFVLTLTADGRDSYALLSERMRTCVNSSHSLAKSASVATTTRTRTRRTTRTA